MAAYNSSTWDDAIEQALQWKKERSETVENLKKRAVEQFDDTLRSLVLPAVLEKLHIEIIANFPEGGDPRYVPASAHATFRTSKASYALHERSDTWEVYPRHNDDEHQDASLWSFPEDLQNQLVLLFLADQERG
jgi:hypothetical protein